MICRILLLIILNSCVCAATFEVNVTQSSYQAEENHNITLEWTFTTKPDSTSNSLFIFCELFTDQKPIVLYELHVHEGVEVSESQDEQFSGRVQGDKDVLREGRIRLHVSRLRINDSGLYQCEVSTDYGSRSGRCELNVTARKRLGEKTKQKRDRRCEATIFNQNLAVTVLIIMIILALQPLITWTVQIWR